MKRFIDNEQNFKNKNNLNRKLKNDAKHVNEIDDMETILNERKYKTRTRFRDSWLFAIILWISIFLAFFFLIVWMLQ